MAYNFKDLKRDFPTEESCLEFIFKVRFPRFRGWYRVKGRKAFANAAGKQIYPLKGTIFEKSDTPLVTWFKAIFFIVLSRKELSAKELERKLGMTYKTAWRMTKLIRPHTQAS